MYILELLAIIKDLCDEYGYALIRLLRLNKNDRSLLSYLVKRGLVKRISRGKYVITEDGLNYLRKYGIE